MDFFQDFPEATGESDRGMHDEADSAMRLRQSRAMDAFGFHTIGPLLYSFHLELDQTYAIFTKQQKALYQVDFLLQKLVEMKNDYDASSYALLRAKLEHARVEASKTFDTEFLQPFRLKSLQTLMSVCAKGLEQLNENENLMSKPSISQCFWKGSLSFPEFSQVAVDATLYMDTSNTLPNIPTDIVFKDSAKISLSAMQSLLSSKSSMKYQPIILASSQIETLLRRTNQSVSPIEKSATENDTNTEHISTNYSQKISSYCSNIFIENNQSSPGTFKLVMLPYLWLFELDLIQYFARYIQEEPSQPFIPCILFFPQ